MRPAYPFAVGSDCTNSLSSVRVRLALVMSTTGLSPVTVIVSWSPPIRMSALMLAMKSLGISTSSRLKTAKPGSVNETMYRAGLQVDDAVLPAAVGDGTADLFDQGGAAGFDGHAGQHRA